jgi:hypothetical protein
MAYKWLGNPADPEAPREMLADVQAIVLAEELDRVKNSSQPEGGMPDEQILEAPRLQGRVQLATGQRLAQITELGDRSLRLWAVEAARNPVYHYHDQEFTSPEELYRAALDGLSRVSSTYYDLDFIATKLHPLAVQAGIEGADRLWNDGLIERTRAVVPALRQAIEQPEADLPAARQIVADVLGMDNATFAAQYKNRRSTLEPMQAYDYKQPKGGYLVIHYQSEGQQLLVEKQLGQYLDTHFGTGDELFLAQLQNKKARGS